MLVRLPDQGGLPHPTKKFCEPHAAAGQKQSWLLHTGKARYDHLATKTAMGPLIRLTLTLRATSEKYCNQRIRNIPLSLIRPLAAADLSELPGNGPGLSALFEGFTAPGKGRVLKPKRKVGVAADPGLMSCSIQNCEYHLRCPECLGGASAKRLGNLAVANVETCTKR